MSRTKCNVYYVWSSFAFEVQYLFRCEIVIVHFLVDLIAFTPDVNIGIERVQSLMILRMNISLAYIMVVV